MQALAQWLNPVIALTKAAGQEVLAIYQQAPDSEVQLKLDGSPLTRADQLADAIICQGLAHLDAAIPILSEESLSAPFSERAKWPCYWLVDPLDGTKEFLAKTGDFTINIALIHHHQPVLGVVYVPVSDEVYFAAKSLGAFKQQGNQTPLAIHTRAYQPGQLHVLASRRHGTTELAGLLTRLAPQQLSNYGSSLKFCLIAAGQADLYPRLSLTSEWDTAAAQCIVEQAGGAVIDLQGLPLHYNLRDSLQNPYFLVVGDKHYNWLHWLN